MAHCHYFLPKTLAISKIAYIKHGRTTMLHAQAINAELFPIIAKTRQAIIKTARIPIVAKTKNFFNFDYLYLYTLFLYFSVFTHNFIYAFI